MEKVYITKYALTSGIKEVEAEILPQDDMICVIPKDGSFPVYFHGEGREWHRTKESAILRAEELRLKKIESLEQKLKKIKELKFD